MKIEEIIVVEGKDDTKRIKEAVEAEIEEIKKGNYNYKGVKG